jgi:hypothetical protein
MYNAPTNDIVIRKAKNGWVLIMPIEEEFFNPVNLVADLKNEFNKDEVLSDIHSKNQSETDVKSVMENENLYIFATFKELLGFLSLNIEE